MWCIRRIYKNDWYLRMYFHTCKVHYWGTTVQEQMFTQHFIDFYRKDGIGIEFTYVLDVGDAAMKEVEIWEEQQALERSTPKTDKKNKKRKSL